VPVIDRVGYLAKNPPKLIGVTIKRIGPAPAPPVPAAPSKKPAAPPAAPAKK
jgi:hypothetical protein